MDTTIIFSACGGFIRGWKKFLKSSGEPRRGGGHNVTIEIKEGVVVMEWIWMLGIIAVAIGAAVGMEWYQRRCRRRKRGWRIEDKAIRFGEEGYIEGVVPIGKVKALARFYLMQHSEENLTLQQAEKRIEERLQSYIREGKEEKRSI